METKKIVSLARTIAKSESSNRDSICQKLLGGLSLNHVDGSTLRAFSGFHIGESFTASIMTQRAVRRALQNERHKFSPEWILNDKPAGRSFAERLGLTVPKVFQCDIPSNDIVIRANSVLKPCRACSSTGVFLIAHKDRILDLKNRAFIDEEELMSRIALLLRNRVVEQDRWQLEALVPSRRFCPLDVKFLCFYGRVALVLEAQRYPELGYNWYTPEGQQIVTGSDEGLEFKGEGIKPEESDAVARLSLEIPVPFMRVDFLRSDDGRLVFGEFTPMPGEFEKFYPDTDSFLGREYYAALARLHDDMLSGKSFVSFLAMRKLEEPKIVAQRLARSSDELPSPRSKRAASIADPSSSNMEVWAASSKRATLKFVASVTRRFWAVRRPAETPEDRSWQV